MYLVKLDATSSTNTYLKEYTRTLKPQEDILVWALDQYGGRGQRGSAWESQPGKNLTFSVFKRVEGFKVDRTFYITMATSLLVYEVLKRLGVRQLAVKWPNDILAGKSKISGILIETVIRNELEAVILGVGMNINQLEFTKAPNATSVLKETGVFYELEEVLNVFKEVFYKYAERIEQGDFAQIKADYEKKLFRKDQVSTFKLMDGSLLTAIIEGVSKTGKLILRLEDEFYKEFDLKELQLLY